MFLRNKVGALCGGRELKWKMGAWKESEYNTTELQARDDQGWDQHILKMQFNKCKKYQTNGIKMSAKIHPTTWMLAKVHVRGQILFKNIV